MIKMAPLSYCETCFKGVFLYDGEMMSRIDVRVECDMVGEWIDPRITPEGKAYPVAIANIGLGGALIRAELPEGESPGLLRLNIDGDEIEFAAEVVRREQAKAAVRFYYGRMEAVSRLWGYIRKGLKGLRYDVCPYCRSTRFEGLAECETCGLHANFYSDNYLVDHGKRTLLNRLTWRLELLHPDRIWSLLNIIDNELLSEESEEEDLEFVGTCKPMLEVFSMIRKVAPTDIPVLILGESGTGKELASKAIHERSSRKDKPFVVINCAAIPETLLEAELFGYERGAFTGAYNARKGKFEHADGGTLFLDEIGELSWSLQAKLLRFLEDKTIERIGSRKSRTIDTRIITATNRDLEREVHEGQFRQDLFYRLSTFSIYLPPLRERGEDKVILAQYFLRKFCKEQGSGGKKKLSREAIDAIRSYDWPGNVREVINKTRRAIVVSGAEEIKTDDLDLPTMDISTPRPVFSLEGIRSAAEREKLVEVINSCGGNLSQAARVLGITRPTLYKLKKKHQV